MIIDIKKYNVANDGKTNVTKDIQKIIDFLQDRKSVGRERVC